jgi:hypothetical protein
VDKEQAMRSSARRLIPPPTVRRRKIGRHNDWGFNPEEQRTRTFLRHGRGRASTCTTSGPWRAWAPIQDRTREHLGTSDKVIMANRTHAARRPSRPCRPAAPPPFGADPAQAAAEQAGGPGHGGRHRAGGTWGTW